MYIASFFLPSHLSFIHVQTIHVVHMYMYMYRDYMHTCAMYMYRDYMHTCTMYMYRDYMHTCTMYMYRDNMHTCTCTKYMYRDYMHTCTRYTCMFALFVCLTLLASFFLPSHLSFKNMYITLLQQHFSAYPEMIVRVFATTAISLDTTYTAKSVQGLVGELQRNPGRFQGKNILFVHTGQW